MCSSDVSGTFTSMNLLLFSSIIFSFFAASADPVSRWNKIQIPFDQKDSFMFGSCEPEIAMLKNVQYARLSERYDDQMTFDVQFSDQTNGVIYNCFDCNRVYNRFVVTTETDKAKACEASEQE